MTNRDVSGFVCVLWQQQIKEQDLLSRFPALFCSLMEQI